MKHLSKNCGSKHWNTKIEDRHVSEGLEDNLMSREHPYDLCQVNASS